MRCLRLLVIWKVEDDKEKEELTSQGRFQYTNRLLHCCLRIEVAFVIEGLLACLEALHAILWSQSAW